MRRWRVGTLTMGIALIVLGVILLTSLIGGYDILDKLMTWWPLILIMVGLEILFYIYRAKEEQVKIKYDIFSMFMIMVIFVTSGTFYGITSTGIVQQLATAVNSREYSIMIPQVEIPVKGNIKKIVITAPGRTSVKINKTDGEKIIYRGNSEVFTSSREMAQETIDKGEIHFNEIENILYIQFPSFERRRDLKTGVDSVSYNLYIPAGLDVEIKGSSGYLSRIIIDGEAIDGTWLISEASNVQILGNSKSNFEVEAITEYQPNLKGNIEWNVNQQEDGYTIGKVSFGGGKFKVSILRSNVEVLNLQ